MLTFRNTNILFLIVLVSVIGYNVNHSISFFCYLVLFIAYSSILFYGSYYIGSSFYLKIICFAKTTKKEIAISFDDGPAKEYTPDILTILKQYNVETAFFCIGKNITGNEEILREIISAGHIIGNHSYSHHPLFDLFSSKKMLADIRMTDAAVEKVTGLVPRLFRPPYGVTNPNLCKAIIKGNYIPIGWNVRSMDTVAKDRQKLLNRVTQLVRPGAIVLFHDTCKITKDILPDFIKQVKNDGYEIVRLDKMLNLNAYA